MEILLDQIAISSSPAVAVSPHRISYLIGFTNFFIPFQDHEVVKP